MYDKEGEVLKLSGYLVKSWEKRWFRLDGPLLFYYVDKQEALYNPGNHRQVFDLKGASFFRAAEGKVNSPTEFCIEIKLPTNPPKFYYFCLNSTEEMNEWLEALEKVTRA